MSIAKSNINQELSAINGDGEGIFRFHALGGPCELRIEDGGTKTDKIFLNARAEINRIEEKYSRYKEASYLSKINKVAKQGGLFTVDSETAALLNYCATCFKESNGLFDITSGVLRRVWDFSAKKLPEKSVLESVLSLVGFDKVLWKDPDLKFLRPGMEIDFGGVCKEYACDRVAELLFELGVKSGYVNLGGDIRVIGPQMNGTPWNIGVIHPRKLGSTVTSLSILEGGIATSGDYERYMIVDGKRYSHILNPKIGYPVNGHQSVTVLAETTIIAGSISTIAMLLAEDESLEFLKESGCSYFAVLKDGTAVKG